jgi:hypothetical protein
LGTRAIIRKSTGARARKKGQLLRRGWGEEMNRLITLEAADVAAVGGDHEARLRGPGVLICAGESRKKQSIGAPAGR